jgi:hypothetical protein
MFADLWESLVKYLEKQPYWEALQPFVLVLAGTVAAEVAAYEYVRSNYSLTSLSLFLRSYLSTRIIVAGAAVVLMLALFRFEPGRRDAREPGRLRGFLLAHRRTIVFRSLVVAVVVSVCGFVYFATAPARASPITIRLMDLPPDVRVDAFTYLVYEMNRMQRQWYFEVDPRPFNAASLSSKEFADCNPENEENAQPLLCYAELASERQGPIIAVTAKPLHDIYFATHRGLASVITTADAPSIAPITSYEFLAYMTVLQSMLLQLDAHGASPADLFTPGSTSSGGAFDFAPSRDLFKPAMLAPRLTPAQETLIFNRFGPEYLGVCSRLLSLDWLYSDRVKDNLSKLFGVTLSH